MNFETELLQKIDRIIDQYTTAHDALENLWRTEILFTWHWWLGLALAVLPWLLWFIVRDRRRQHSLFYAALFIMLTASLLDMAGVSQGGWKYNSLLLPYFPQYLPWDLTIFPVTAMLFYQFLRRVNPWIKGALFAAAASYIVEPVFIWLGIYEQANWEHYYSLPIYFVIYMVGYWLYKRSLNEADDAVFNGWSALQ